METITTENRDARQAMTDILKTYSENRDPMPLAKVVAYSVLKKLLTTEYNPTLAAIRSELGRDLHNLDYLHYANMTAYAVSFNENGDYKRIKADPVSVSVLDKLSRLSLGDGIDFVNTAVIAIMEETEKQTERDPDLPVDLERPYTIRRLNRKVWIKKEDTVNGWEEVSTTPISEIYRAVRRYVVQSRAAETDPRNGYSYLEDMTTDPETGTETTIYKRLPKYSNLGGYVTDYNGEFTLYTVDNETVDQYETLVESLRLTAKQATILKLKQSGHGNKAIATYLGISENSVKGACNEIKRKAKEYFPAELLEKYVK